MSKFRSVSRGLIAVLGAALLCAPAYAAESSPLPGALQPTVVFVCDHGSVKSLFAASLFNRMAEERGLTARALSRAASAQTVDAKVPDKVVQLMAGDGFQVAAFKPQPLTPADVSSASRVILINLDGPVESASRAPVERWNGIAPIGTEYGTAKSQLASRVEALLDQVAAREGNKAGK